MKFNLYILSFVLCLSTVAMGQIDGTTEDKNEASTADSNLVDLDPNRMEVNPFGIIPFAELEDGITLEYDIYFQNLLNEPVNELTIVDTLSEYLEFTSIQMKSSSHEYELYPIPPNIMVWKFYNVNLMDSTIGKEKSKGKIRFSVDIKPDINLGDSILNRAHIIFDSDILLITNKVWNAFDLPTGMGSENINENSILYPNPGHGIVYYRLAHSDKRNYVVRVFDVNAKLINEFSGIIPNEGNLSFDVSDLPTGLYSVQISSGKFVKSHKLIVK